MERTDISTAVNSTYARRSLNEGNIVSLTSYIDKAMAQHNIGQGSIHARDEHYRANAVGSLYVNIASRYELDDTQQEIVKKYLNDVLKSYAVPQQDVNDQVLSHHAMHVKKISAGVMLNGLKNMGIGAVLGGLVGTGVAALIGDTTNHLALYGLSLGTLCGAIYGLKNELDTNKYAIKAFNMHPMSHIPGTDDYKMHLKNKLHIDLQKNILA